MKRFLTLIAVLALMATSMIAGSVTADEIGTTLTVERSVPACADAKLSSISFRSTAVGGGFFFSAAGITPTNPPSTTIAVQSNATNIDWYVNTCHPAVQWNVYLSLSDFTSGSSTISAADTIQIRGHSSASYTGVYRGGTTTVFGPGATSTMTTAWRDYAGSPIQISHGTATNPVPASPSTLPGGFSQNVQFGINNIPSSTPPGTYVSTIKATLTVAAP